MHSSFRSLCTVLLASAVLALAETSEFNLANFKGRDIIFRDVAVVGGGSSGTYSAISLKDKGQSVIVVEKQDRLGGHADTYVDPETGIPVDLGVLTFHNISVVTDFFRRFDVPLNGADQGSILQSYYDFRSGKEVTQRFNPPAEEVGAAFATYLAQYAKYPGLGNGTFLPNPVPEDLYMSFGDFVEKYGIQAVIPTMYTINPGVGDILSNPTVEQFRYMSSYVVLVFTRAAAELSSSSSLLLSSEVLFARRSHGKCGVKLVVRTPSGLKLIIAKKLLIAFPPKRDILAPFDLSATEKSLFGKYIATGYYVGLVKNSGMPTNAIIFNAAADNTKYTFAHLPGAYSFIPTAVAGLHRVYYATPQSSKSFPLSDDVVKADIIKAIKQLQNKNPDKFPPGEPEFVTFSSHAPYSLHVSSEDIKDGFYDKLYKLQGERNTHWTGAAWKAHDTSLIWKYSEEFVVPQIIAGL
ncbi:hypothetical protein EMPG_14543 [Blastomyces silverae]|uniref:Amine oxidase domain-containing protein n=1 Tax=Blastomyces silverae TaxID=2060906 RepID=A0A0H1BG16_9EURO|nr:hypothetical protein EMPG_14543 [Blastomyces silverae]